MIILKVGLDYDEEVHNVFGYEICSSLVGVYTMVKTFSVENFKHGRKNDMVVNMATFIHFIFVRGILWRSNFSGNFKPLDKKNLSLQRSPTRGNLF